MNDSSKNKVAADGPQVGRPDTDYPLKIPLQEDLAKPLVPLIPESAAWKLLAGTYVFLVALQICYLVWIGNGLGKYCDLHSEADALRSAAAYLKDGLTSHHGLPRLLYGGRFPNVGTIIDHIDTNGLVPLEFRRGFPESLSSPNNWVYTHYPPGPNLICAMEARWVGLDRIWVLRLFPLLTGLSAAAVFFLQLARVFGPDRGALIALGCVVLPMFNTYMPGLHYQGYSFALLLLELTVLLRAWWSRAGFRGWHWPVLFLLGFLQGWLSFDQFFVVSLTPIPLWLIRRAEGGHIDVRGLIWSVGLLFSGFMFAHILHFLQVAAELGGLHQAFEEFRRTAGERAGSTGSIVLPKLVVQLLGPIDNHLGYFGSLALGSYYYIREILLMKGLQFGPFLFLALVAVLPLAVIRTSHSASGAFGCQARLGRWLRWPGPGSLWPAVGAALMVSLSWLFVMPAHVVGNRHITVRHLFVLYFCLLLVLVQSIRSGRR